MSEPAADRLVHLARDIEASASTVWRILTTPELFSTWMEGRVEFDARVGSPFRADFPQFQTTIAGEVVTVDSEARLLGVTWGLEQGEHAEAFPAGCSLVEFRVHDAERGCRVEVSHSRLPSAPAAEQNEQGWKFHLSRLAVYANRTDLEAGLQRTLAGWFAAWNEQDDAKRAEVLRSCCVEDVEFRDEWAVARGVELLSLHIANCFRFVPGWKIEPTADIRICRGEALVGWRSAGPGGATLVGHNHVVADHDGTIRRVAGFQTQPAVS